MNDAGHKKEGPVQVMEDEELEGADRVEPRASYDREMSGTQLDSYIDDIADTVRVGLDQSISILTPWFFNNMPKIYYQTTPRQEKIRHLSAIITGHVFETKQTVELWDRDKSKVTYIGPGGDGDILLDMARRLQPNDLKMGGLYFSRDRLLFLSTFFCRSVRGLDLNNNRILEKVNAARLMMRKEFPDDLDQIEHYIKHLDNDFVVYATAARLSITYRMLRHMLSHQGAHTFVDPFDNSPLARLTLGIKNVKPSEMMEPVLHLIHRYEFNVGRSFVIKLEEGYDESCTVMHFILSHTSGQKVAKDFVPMIRLIKALRTLGWVDNDEYSEFTRDPYDFSMNAVNLIRSMANWCHLFLSKRTPYAYSMYRIRNTFFKYPELTREVVELFRLKFDPQREGDRSRGAFENDWNSLATSVTGVIEEIDRAIFHECMHFIRHCVKSNYFLPTKTGHAFRFEPDVLDPKYYRDMPYGLIYITGRDFRAFQVRWKDIARGGMRVVMPRNAADYDFALSGLFDEVYGLSLAQQLKNKDIPEGGSKAVLVLRPGGHRDQAVKSCVNALIDLLVEDDEAHEANDKLVSYLENEEIIYLGPDENITNTLINWIPHHAERRGYRYASAFMSSKPGAGINHKEYGVTSEGVNVYVDNTLHHLGIEPRKERFRVSITGGPDGDVAGNEMRILHREYNENARVISVADGLGCAYDPDGLNWGELLRLVAEGSSIVRFNKEHLTGSGAFVLEADTNENILIRNDLFMRYEADVFIPAGGRPFSVNDKNWKKFLDASGKPRIRAVVEGANIFFTPEARKRLEERGVVMIKDSTANKTGVICSSYEIIASLTFTPEEFAAIKTEYVGQVIRILRAKADAEAKLLFREHAKDGQKSLVEMSMEISREIDDLTDILLDHLDANRQTVLADEFFQSIILRHCPPLLSMRYREQVLNSLPDSHKIAIISSFVASYVVYREGLGWLRSVPRDHWYDALQIYMEKDRLASRLLESLNQTEMQDKDQVSAILTKSAARDLTIMELQKKLIVS